VGLTVFDKIHLAHCAIQRAQNNFMDKARFVGEYDSVLCWYNHRVCFLTTPSGPLSYSET
jgi:hypothetical protein